LAERRYAACDPDNRLIAAQLEKDGEAALRRVEESQARLEPETGVTGQPSDAADFAALAIDLETAWTSPNVSMRARQQLLRAVIVDIVVDIDEAAREVILTIHWRGGQRSQLCVRKSNSGEHGRQTPEEALAIMRSMAARWSDEHIAASLNRMGMRTGQGKKWTGLDLAKNVFQVHGVDTEGNVVVTRNLRRGAVPEFFRRRRAAWWRWRPARARTIGDGRSPRSDMRRG
jgi:hypothetical protein